MFENRLKLICTLLSGLVVVLCVIASLTGRLPDTYTAFKENMGREKISKQLLEPYNVMDNSFHFELPDTWNTNEISFPGGEILYHMSFSSKDKRVTGFVQVWKLTEPLKKFVEKSKESAVGAVDFKHFEIKEIMIDNKRGYLLDYSRANSSGDYYKGYEAFVEGCCNKVYRVSFFVPEKEWRNYYKVLFDRIIRTIKIKE